MISKVSIRNFKSLRNVDVDLERFTVFVGPNASGKTSILQAIHQLCSAFQSAPAGGFGFGNHDWHTVVAEECSRGSTDPVVLAAYSAENWYRFGTRSRQSRAKTQHGWDGTGTGHASSLSDQWKQWKTQSTGVSPLPSSVCLRLETSQLIQPVPTGGLRQFQNADLTEMSSDGSGLHSALASMTLNDPDAWQSLQEDLRRIIPTIRRLRHTKSQPTSLLFDTIGAESLTATQVSEGTLLVLGLLTVLHSPSRPNLILLDDLDRGLHPKAQRELIALLRALLATNPDLQVVATTHSPYMLDCMDVKEVRMTFLKENGSTVCAPLSDHPDFPKWKNEMTPGEMWSLFGEKWLAGEVAA